MEEFPAKTNPTVFLDIIYVIDMSSSGRMSQMSHVTLAMASNPTVGTERPCIFFKHGWPGNHLCDG